MDALPDLSKLDHAAKDALILELFALLSRRTERVAELEAKLSQSPKEAGQFEHAAFVVPQKGGGGDNERPLAGAPASMPACHRRRRSHLCARLAELAPAGLPHQARMLQLSDGQLRAWEPSSQTQVIAWPAAPLTSKVSRFTRQSPKLDETSSSSSTGATSRPTKSFRACLVPLCHLPENHQ